MANLPFIVIVWTAAASATVGRIITQPEAPVNSIVGRRRKRVARIEGGHDGLKNSGFAAATALALLNDRASVPGAVVSAVITLYLIWLGLRGIPGPG